MNHQMSVETLEARAVSSLLSIFFFTCFYPHNDMTDSSILKADPKTIAVIEHKGYVVLRKISQGAFGQVYKARDVKHDELAAVKVMDLQKVAAKGLQNKFLQREIHALKTVVHPNVLKVQHIFQSGGRLYIFMEFAPNGCLKDKVKTAPDKHLKEPEAKHWFKQVVDALHCMHLDYKICHRDIKLENVLLDAHDNCKLTDFGFTRDFSEEFEEQTSPPLARTLLGTKPYYAPQLLERKRYNPFLYDVWSMGVMLFTMLNGRFPFPPKLETRELLVNMKQRNYNVNPDVFPKLSARVKDLMNQMMSYDEKKRLNIIGVRNHSWLTGIKSYE